MKFYGTPNMLVKQRKRKKMSTEYELKPVFRFDENGEFITDDEKLIKKLAPKFRHEEDPDKKICKQCGQPFDNTGALLAHYRLSHPKEATQ